MNQALVIRTIAVDHPAFAGHFPGRPLLPGAALLAEALEAARLQPHLAAHLASGSTLTVAKFLAPVGPGGEISFALEWDDAGLRFEATQAGVAVAKGHWQWRQPQEPI